MSAVHGIIVKLFDTPECEMSWRGWVERWAHRDRELVMLRTNGESSWLTREDARRLAAALIEAAKESAS